MFSAQSDRALSHLTINDTTPGYTTFVSAATGTTPATLTNCMKNTPADPSAVACADAQVAGGVGPISWSFAGSVLPGGTGTVLFRVKVD